MNLIEQKLCVGAGERNIIFGAGEMGKILYHSARAAEVEVECFADESEEPGRFAEGLPIQSIYRLAKGEARGIRIFLAVGGAEKRGRVTELLLHIGFTKEQIIIFDMLAEPAIDLFDPMLGYSRQYEVPGYRVYGNTSPSEGKRIVVFGGSNSEDRWSGFPSWVELFHERILASGREITVWNGAIRGYDSSGELEKLARDVYDLKPHTVISFSGIVDALAIARQTKPEVQITKAGDYLRNVLDKARSQGVFEKKITYGIGDQHESAARWISNMKMMDGICGSLGIPFYGFLQPLSATGGYVKSDYERRYESYYWGEDFFSAVKTAYDSMREGIEKEMNIHDLTELFSGMSDRYIDLIHYTEKANREIADAVFAAVFPGE